MFLFLSPRPSAVSIMDFNNLKEAVSGLTLYDLKAGVRKVQNGALLCAGDGDGDGDDDRLC